MLRVLALFSVGVTAANACATIATTATGCTVPSITTDNDVVITYNTLISGTRYPVGTTATITCNGIGTNKNLWDGTTAYTSAQTITCGTNNAWSNANTWTCGCLRPTSPASNFWGFITAMVVPTGSVYSLSFDAKCAETVGSASTNDWATIGGVNPSTGSQQIVTCTNDGSFTIITVSPTSATASTLNTQANNPAVVCQATEN